MNKNKRIQMVGRCHLLRQPDPKTEHRQKFRREIKVILEKECSDDAG